MKLYQHPAIEFKYKVLGDKGPVYVLFHGFGGSPNDWSQIAEALAQKNRVVIPNLKSFISHIEPLSFSRQVEILATFLHHMYDRKGVKELNLIGQSFGATLSLGLRLSGDFKIKDHILINPMPFNPFEFVRETNIKVLMSLGYLPGGVNFFLKTNPGRKNLEELAKIFRIGSPGAHEVHNFNSRKLTLVVKAFERFSWIEKNENWSMWQNRLCDLGENLITRFIYSSEDSIYSAEDYQAIASSVKSKEVSEIVHKGHLLVQDKSAEIMDQIGFGSSS